MAKQIKRKRLVLLDSHALLHSSYHALPDLSSSKGEPTGALFGLVSRILKIAADLKPDYIVAARDLPGPTHRHEAFEEYKATRVETEDELIEQLKRAPKVFDAFGIPTYSEVGLEADDVIGSIVEAVSSRKDLEVVIVTGDADLFQLVSPRTFVYKTGFSLNELKFYDEDAVREKYGFGPELVTDYKGIVGDPSDNIPGVPGVGKVSAEKLVAQYGTLEKIYAALQKKGVEGVAKESGVRKSYVQLVADNKKQALFSKELATIHTEAAIDFRLPEAKWDLTARAEQVFELCDTLEFRSLKERVRGLTKVTPKALFETGEETAPVVPADELRETSIALWLLRSDTTDPSLEDILRYAKTDLPAQAGGFEKARTAIFAELKKTGHLQDVFDEIEKPLIPVVERMNATGVYLDTKHLKELASEYGKELGKIAARIYKAAGHEFNLNSPKQLAGVLYDELGITPAQRKLTAGGARTTRESELAKLVGEHKVVADVLAYRELQKLLSTYVEKMPGLVGKDGRLHAEFVQAGTTTGRMSSQDPNLQNIPVKSAYGRRIREAFAAPRGRRLLSLDYSQVELRIAAGLSGDKALVQIFKEGGDVHSAVASRVFGVPVEKVDYEMRRRAKVINFGILYGMGVNALRANLSNGGQKVSQSDAAAFLKAYFDTFSGLADYIERTKQKAEKDGYTETVFGRRRYFAGFSSKLPQLKAQAARMATNAPMQGTQSDIIKLAMVRADELIERKKWRQSAQLVLQVHDELMYEVEEKLLDEAATAIREVMEAASPSEKLSGVPIVVEAKAGKNWGVMKKL